MTNILQDIASQMTIAASDFVSGATFSSFLQKSSSDKWAVAFKVASVAIQIGLLGLIFGVKAGIITFVVTTALTFAWVARPRKVGILNFSS